MIPTSVDLKLNITLAKHRDSNITDVDLIHGSNDNITITTVFNSTNTTDTNKEKRSKAKLVVVA